MATFGEKIKAIRYSLEYTQEELANKLGVTKQVISKYENEQTSPRLDTVIVFADLLNIDLTYLINDKYSISETVNALGHKNKSTNSTYYLDPETREIAEKIHNNKELSLLFDAARDASPEDLETAHTILKALKDKENNND